MSTFDSTLPSPDPSPEPTPATDLSIPMITIPDAIPPSGPAIELPPTEVMPHSTDEPIGDPDEGGEKDDFAEPPEVEPLIEGGDLGSDQVIAAGADAGAADSGDGLDASGGSSDGGGSDGGGTDGGAGDDAGGGGDSAGGGDEA